VQAHNKQTTKPLYACNALHLNTHTRLSQSAQKAHQHSQKCNVHTHTHSAHLNARPSCCCIAPIIKHTCTHLYETYEYIFICKVSTTNPWCLSIKIFHVLRWYDLKNNKVMLLNIHICLTRGPHP
jgi:hypothetical protein